MPPHSVRKERIPMRGLKHRQSRLQGTKKNTVRKERIPMRGLKPERFPLDAKPTSICQKRTNPHEGIETPSNPCAGSDRTPHVRKERIPMRGLKPIGGFELAVGCDSQKRTNPHEGIETYAGRQNDLYGCISGFVPVRKERIPMRGLKPISIPGSITLTYMSEKNESP